MTQQKVEPFTPLELTDLQVKDIEGLITLPSGEVRSVFFRTIPFSRWVDIGSMIPEPIAPIMGVDKNGRPVYNLQDPGYKRALQDATNERMYLRMAATIGIGLPGETLEEKATWLRENTDTSVGRQLQDLLHHVSLRQEARLMTPRAIFPKRDPARTPDPEAMADPQVPVAETP